MSQDSCTAYTPEPVKLSELRAKTDQQLLKLIHSKVELGLSVLALVEEAYLDGNPDHSEWLLRRAEQAVVEVKQLLPVLSEDQRSGFGPHLVKLQEALDRLSRNRGRLDPQQLRCRADLLSKQSATSQHSYNCQEHHAGDL